MDVLAQKKVGVNPQRKQRRPKQLEAIAQTHLFLWRDMNLKKGKYPGLHLMFAIPNGAFLQGDARRRAMQWARLKKQGAKQGVSDVFLPVAIGKFHGLWIEMKAVKPHSATVTDEQREWIEEMRKNGYRAYVAYGCDEAIAYIDDYYYGRR